MKTISLYFTAMLALLTAGLLAGCSDKINYIDNIIEDDIYLYCNLSSYTFSADGEKDFTLKVESSSEWQYEIADDAEWIKVVRNDKGITIDVDANDTGDIRIGSVAFSNQQNDSFTFYLTQSFTVQFENYIFMKILKNPLVISTDGTYAAYVDTQIIDPIYYTSQYTPVIVNLKTGETTLCESNTEEPEEPSFISNTGVLATMKNYNLTARLYDINDGTPKDILYPDYTWTFVAAMNSDASVMVGYVSTGMAFYPAKWVGGQLTILDYPETSIYGTSLSHGAVIRGGSKDLTVLYGSDWTWGSYAPIVWNNDIHVGWGSDIVKRLTVLEDVYDAYGQYEGVKEVEVIAGPRMANDLFHMSLDGRYATCLYLDWEAGEDGFGVQTDYPVVYNTVDGTTEVLKNMPGCHGIHVNNDGVVFATDFSNLLQPGYVYDKGFGQVETTAAWMLRKYGVMIPEDSSITYISEDGNTVLGRTLRQSVKEGGQHLYWIFYNANG